MSEVKVKTATGKFQQTISIGKHQFIADEPESNGGDDAGPAPHEILLASLGACTSMTLQMYAQRKNWVVRSIEVTLHGKKEDDGYHITRSISFEGELDAEQRKKLLEIAEKCPVHKTLSSPIKIVTREG
jgi:putative redox protein